MVGGFMEKLHEKTNGYPSKEQPWKKFYNNEELLNLIELIGKTLPKEKINITDYFRMNREYVKCETFIGNLKFLSCILILYFTSFSQ